MTIRTTCLLSAVLAFSVASCGDSGSAPAATKPAAPAAGTPAAPAAKPAAPATPSAPEAAVAAVQSTLAALQAEAAKADKPTLEKVIAECKALITSKEGEIKTLTEKVKEKAGELAKSALGGAGGADVKAQVDKLNTQLEGLKKELAGLNEKLSVFVAELAKRPA